MMAALMIVEFLEVMQFSPQVISAPKRHLIEIFSPDCSNEPFDVSAKEWHIGNGIHSNDVEYSKIGLPSVEMEQRIIVTADVSRRSCAPDCSVEHLTQCGSIDRSRVYAKANFSARELVRNHENPVASEYQRLATKQIDASETVF